MIDKRLLTLLAVGLLCLPAMAPRYDAQQVELQANNNTNKPVNKIIHLAPPAAVAVEPNATGIAKIQVKTKGNAQQRFQVVGANLKAGTAYTLFVTVNGMSVQVATEMAAVDEDEDEDESGAAVEFIFFQKAKGKIGEDERPLPAPLDPLTQITAVTLRDSAGNVVLSGNFPQ